MLTRSTQRGIPASNVGGCGRRIGTHYLGGRVGCRIGRVSGSHAASLKMQLQNC
jgi:hypothetical protein